MHDSSFPVAQTDRREARTDTGRRLGDSRSSVRNSDVHGACRIDTNHVPFLGGRVVAEDCALASEEQRGFQRHLTSDRSVAHRIDTVEHSLPSTGFDAVPDPAAGKPEGVELRVGDQAELRVGDIFQGGELCRGHTGHGHRDPRRVSVSHLGKWIALWITHRLGITQPVRG